MATAQRQHDPSMGATLALTLVVAAFGAGALGGTLALLDGFSPATAPVLTNVDAAAVVFLCGLVGVAYFLPVGILLALS